MRNKLWILCGTLAVVLGVLGILLPILPTTPFMLLAAFCYGRGSAHFYDWLVNRSRFGAYIRDYREGRGIPVEKKVLMIAFLWLTIGATTLLAVNNWWIRGMLVLIAVGVTIHLVRIKNQERFPVSSRHKSIKETALKDELTNGY
jgi:uncharacterized membrane protein YbaN (DUF454 family)